MMERSLTEDWFFQLMNDKPKLRRLVKRIEAMESIQAHYKKHPDKNVCQYYAKVPFWRQHFETLIFHMITIGLGVVLECNLRVANWVIVNAR